MDIFRVNITRWALYFLKVGEWVIFQARVREILKNNKILYVFISILLFRKYESLYMTIFEL